MGVPKTHRRKITCRGVSCAGCGGLLDLRRRIGTRDGRARARMCLWRLGPSFRACEFCLTLQSCATDTSRLFIARKALRAGLFYILKDAIYSFTASTPHGTWLDI